MPRRPSEDDLRDALRLSKLIEGLPVRPLRADDSQAPRGDRTLTQGDLDAIGDVVVAAIAQALKDIVTGLLWDLIRKLLVTGALAVVAVDQLKKFFH